MGRVVVSDVLDGVPVKADETVIFCSVHSVTR
jgi:hypothetical protein